jgi:hypothetical protein
VRRLDTKSWRGSSMIAPHGSQDQAMAVHCTGDGYLAGVAVAGLGPLIRVVRESSIVDVPRDGGLVRIIDPCILPAVVGERCAGAKVTRRVIGFLVGSKPGRPGPRGYSSPCRRKGTRCTLLGGNQDWHSLAVPALHRGRGWRASARRCGSGPECEVRTCPSCLPVAMAGILVIHGRQDVNDAEVTTAACGSRR